MSLVGGEAKVKIAQSLCWGMGTITPWHLRLTPPPSGVLSAATAKGEYEDQRFSWSCSMDAALSTTVTWTSRKKKEYRAAAAGNIYRDVIFSRTHCRITRCTRSQKYIDLSDRAVHNGIFTRKHAHWKHERTHAHTKFRLYRERSGKDVSYRVRHGGCLYNLLLLKARARFELHHTTRLLVSLSGLRSWASKKSKVASRHPPSSRAYGLKTTLSRLDQVMTRLDVKIKGTSQGHIDTKCECAPPVVLESPFSSPQIYFIILPVLLHLLTIPHQV